MLKLYDSMRGEKVEFTPLKPGKVSLYACGDTVYDACHIGHARGKIGCDVLIKLLKALDYDVTYVRNITDIDDKIITRAAEKNITSSELSNKCIKEMHEDYASLGMASPDHEPRATEYITEIIALIEKLIAKDNAYVTAAADVCFAIESCKNYGKLSHRSIEDMLVGTRSIADKAKKNPLDFVLWKAAKPGEPSWPSPWGEGRPGWHIECSAMAMALLGDTFDIHAGGMDLKFPHHENEIAQSECATDKCFARWWLHYGLVQVDGEKMSKSLGNFLLLRDLRANHHAEVIRFWMLSSHYRSPINFADESMKQAEQSVRRLYTALQDISVEAVDCKTIMQTQQEDIKAFIKALLDDLNTPLAISHLFSIGNKINSAKTAGNISLANELASLLLAAGKLLGILLEDANEFLAGNKDNLDITLVESLIAKRDLARTEKNWSLADEIRGQLKAMGVEIDDVSGKTRWRSRD